MPHHHGLDAARRASLSRWRFIQVAVICLLVVAGACSSDGVDKLPVHAGDATSVDDAVASGVGVLAWGCGPAASAGSGVVLGAPGQVVTVAHTVAGATSITVVTTDGTEFDARVVAFDPLADLAVLAVDDLTAPSLAVGNVRLGDATLLVWSTDDGAGERPVEVTQRLAITIDDIYSSSRAERSGFEISGDVVVGDSGGPVISPDGKVIGIVYARSRSRASTAFASDADEISAVLVDASADSVDNGTCV